MRHFIFTGIFCSLALFNPHSNTLHAQGQGQFEEIGRVVLNKGNLDIYGWNEFLIYSEDVSFRAKIPVPVLVGIAIHESAYFGSDLAKNARNIYGITAFRDWNNRSVYRKGHPIWNANIGKFENKNTPFRFYESIGESVYDFAAFISHPRYDKARTCGNDVKCFLEELQKAGYAQDKNWASKIYKMLLRYDVLNTKIHRRSLGR